LAQPTHPPTRPTNNQQVAKRIAIILNPPRGDGRKSVPTSVGEAAVEVVLDMQRIWVRALVGRLACVVLGVGGWCVRVGRSALLCRAGLQVTA